MKRSPLKRKSKLKRGTWPRRHEYGGSISINWKPSDRRRRCKRIIRERSGGRCEERVDGICTLAARDGHEILPRSAGGDDGDPKNVLDVCRVCHDWIHQHPAAARARGLLVSRYPQTNEPVLS